MNESVENQNWVLRLSWIANKIYMNVNNEPFIKGLFRTESFIDAVRHEFNSTSSNTETIEKQLKSMPFIREYGNGLWAVTRTEKIIPHDIV